MPAPEAVVAVLREWIAKADNDLTAGAQIIKLGDAAPTDTVCFHAQQCVEKYLKALLVFQSVPFCKTHDIQKLMSLIAPALRPDLTEAEQVRLTEYAADIRYPDAGLVITLRDARHALAIARRVRRQIRRLLPRQALRRKRK